MSGAMQFSRGYTVLPDISQSVSVMPGVILNDRVRQFSTFPSMMLRKLKV